jgi:3-methyladenine DNA glycosylase AlkD
MKFKSMKIKEEKMNKFHLEILGLIKQNSGTPTQHTFLDSYLGNDHPRYPINVPTLRLIGKEWSAAHRSLGATEFQKIVDSLIHGESATEKNMAGILLDLSSKDQRKFDPSCFDKWLDQLIGWAEIDSVCTGAYTVTEIPANWNVWNGLLIRFSKSKNISKRRASLVLLCSPMRKAADERLATAALANIDRLKGEPEILITKAISWLLRSMIKNHRKDVVDYLNKNHTTLPKIAVRETQKVLDTGKKTG